jgi:hypothetical protein
MSFLTSKNRSLVLAQAVLLIGATASAAAAQGRDVYAQGREIFNWTGTVDREVEITMRNRSISVRGVNGGEDRGRAQVLGALPRDDGYVDVRVQDGRGDVAVIQQPSSRNDYTTIVRIRDRNGGADRYRVSAAWRSYDRAGAGRASGRIGDGGYGRDDDRGRGRNDRNDRGNGRNDRDDRDYGGIASAARRTMSWTGQVDDVLQIRIQGDRVTYRTVSGKSVRDVRTDITRYGLPRDNVELIVRRRSGRGSVRVLQNPAARNGYTGIIEVRDLQGGYDWYDLDVTWAGRNDRRY